MAIVMDGNRRWARSKGFIPMRGHEEGAKSIERVVDFCLEKGIRHVSLYTFSIENFKRSEREKSFLFNLLAKEAQKGTQDFIDKGVCVRFVGDRSLFPKKLKTVFEKLERETAHLDKLRLNFLFDLLNASTISPVSSIHSPNRPSGTSGKGSIKASFRPTMMMSRSIGLLACCFGIAADISDFTG